MQSLRNCFRRGIVGTGLLTLLYAVAGNAAAPTDSTWVARSWQSDEGLPDNSVCGVAQTPEGYLWVGTHGGLVRFDGVRFEEFPPQSISGVPNQVVRSMLLDRDGRLWLGMDRGPVVRIGENGARVFTTQEGLPDLQMTSMTEDEQGAIWVGYTTGPLIRIQGDEVKVFGAADGLPQEGPCWLATDREGQLWFARSGHVGVYRNQRLQTVLTLDEPTAIGRASAGGLWVCSGSKWFKFVEGHSPENRGTLPSSSRSVEPRVILEDSSGAVWIGTTASGLFRCEGSEVKRVEISHREIWCLTEDREGNIWAGTGGGGLNRLRRRTVELIGREDGLPFESVRSVCEDSQGNIWVVTQNGVVARHENKRWNTVSANGGWPGGHATCITSDRAGSIWIGTREHGLYLFKDGQFENFSRAEGLASLSVRSVLASASGDLWIGTDSPNQVQRLRDGEFHSFGISTAPRFIRAMAEDSTGTIWIGTADGQLFRVNGHELISQPASFQGRPRSIRCLHATSDGSLWIGYAGWGLGRLKDGRLSRIELSSGLHDNHISQIVSDGRGALWFAGNRGIFQVRQKRLIEVLEGRAEHVRSIVYGRGEGLPSLQASFDYFPGALRDRNGRLWIPTRAGLAVVFPERIQENTEPPSVLIERVSVDAQAVALYGSRYPLRGPAAGLGDLRNLSGALRLPPEHRKLDVEFTALSFGAPENVHFRYRLEGFEEDWNDIGPKRSATFPRLPAGHYRFRVSACNHTGVWNETGASLGLTVLPFFWQTWWFRISSLAVFTLGVIAIVRYVSFRRLRQQMRQLEEQAALQKERIRIAKDIHDDLGANLTQIAFLGELARQDQSSPDMASEHVEKISRTARHAVKALDEIVWAINPRNDTLGHLIDYTGQFALDYLRLAGIRCRLDLPDQPPHREISSDVRHNLFLAVKEAINNIVKHAQASEVWLRIHTQHGHLRLEIEDNGRGFASPPEHDGADGLKNIRQRVHEIGGHCRIQSEPGHGTKITIDLGLMRN